MSDIREGAYTEVCDQLEQLEETYNLALERKDAKIERLKALLTRAADSLEQEHSGRIVLPMSQGCPCCNLINELRKAAE